MLENNVQVAATEVDGRQGLAAVKDNGLLQVALRGSERLCKPRFVQVKRPGYELLCEAPEYRRS